MKRHYFISALSLALLLGHSVTASADSARSEQVRDANRGLKGGVITRSLPSSAFGYDAYKHNFTSDRTPQNARPIYPLSRSSVRSGSERFQELAAVSISASQAKAIALRHVPGSIYRDLKLIDGSVYRVRVEKDGHRIDVYVDGNTGRVR